MYRSNNLNNTQLEMSLLDLHITELQLLVDSLLLHLQHTLCVPHSVYYSVNQDWKI